MTQQNEVQAWRDRWDDAIGEAILVDLTVEQYWPHSSMSAERLQRIGVNLESEEAKKAAGEILRGGRIDHIPPKAYRPVQTAAARLRANLDKHAHKVLWGRLIGPSAFPEWKEEHDRLEAEFYASISNMVFNFYQHRAEAEGYYQTLFSNAWERLSRLGEVELSRGEFVDEAIRDIAKDVPSPSQIEEKYDVRVTFDYAPTSTEIQEKEVQAQERRESFLRSASQQDEKRAQIVATMRAQVKAQVEARRQQVEESLAAAERSFHEKVISVIEGAQAGLADRDGKLGRSAVAIRNLVKSAKSLNIFDDEDLAERVSSLSEAAEAHLQAGDKNEATLVELDARLNSLATYARKSIDSIPVSRGIRRVADLDSNEGEEALSVTKRRIQDVDEVAPEVNPIQRRRVAVV